MLGPAEQPAALAPPKSVPERDADAGGVKLDHVRASFHSSPAPRIASAYARHKISEPGDFFLRKNPPAAILQPAGLVGYIRARREQGQREKTWAGPLSSESSSSGRRRGRGPDAGSLEPGPRALSHPQCAMCARRGGVLVRLR